MKLPLRPCSGNPQKAFSLVEVITVISILVILMTAGVSLLGSTGIQSRKAGMDMISGLVEQARTIAITSRSDVFLVIAEPGDLPAQDERCRIGLLRLRKPAPGSSQTSAVRYDLITRWQTLNTGVILIGGEVDGIRNPMDEPEIEMTYGPANKEKTVRVHAIAINSRGSLVQPNGSDPVVFRLAEGAYRGGVASPNKRGAAGAISDSHLKVGRVMARPYRIN